MTSNNLSMGKKTLKVVFKQSFSIHNENWLNALLKFTYLISSDRYDIVDE